MRKITRCPGCATRFKVVPDQLRISQGWVRCGVCGEVFDASKHLLVPSRRLAAAAAGSSPTAAQAAAASASAPDAPAAPAPPAATADSTAPVPQQATQEAAAQPQAHLPLDTLALDTASFEPSGAFPAPPDSGGAWDLQLTQPQPTLPGAAQQPPLPAPDNSSAPANTGTSTDMDADASAAAQALLDAALPDTPPLQRAPKPHHKPHGPHGPHEAPEPLLDEAPTQPAIAPIAHTPARKAYKKSHAGKAGRARRARAKAATPDDLLDGPFADSTPSFAWPQSVLPPEEIEQLSFVRHARQQQFWRRPAVRAALLAACVLTVSVLALQMAQHQRDTLAAHHPALAPALRALCRLSGCTLQARRAIDDIVISNSVFWRVPESGQYQWDLSLENRSPAAVAMPALELTLSDLRGTPLLRRVVLPEEIQAPPLLAARAAWSITAPVAVQDLSGQIASYRAQVFYP